MNFLQNPIDPALTNILESYPTCTEEELMFQQDGAPPHYLQNIRNYLINDRFQSHWI